jgi:hypothetical protein
VKEIRSELGLGERENTLLTDGTRAKILATKLQYKTLRD